MPPGPADIRGAAAPREPAEMREPAEVRRVVVLVVAVQLVQAVDFAMILPLGPDLVEPLGIPGASLGLLVAAYTGAAMLAGIVAAPVLDRFDRRRALCVALVGLSLAAVAGAFATGLGSMLVARALSGAFGGPAATLGQSIVADAIPDARRGRAMGNVLGANALAAILGVPLGLWLAGAHGWRAPFLAVGAAIALVTLLAWASLPAMTSHRRADAHANTGTAGMLARPVVRRAYGLVFLVVGSSFLLTPNLSAFVQHNLGLARADLPGLYAVGGGCAIVSAAVVGRAVDSYGAFRMGSLALVGFAAVAAAFVIAPTPLLPIPLGFVLLLVSLNARNVASRTLATRVPAPHERGRFLSLQSAVHYAAAAVGALGSAAWLSADEEGALVGLESLAWLSIALTAAIPALLRSVEREVRDHALPTASRPILTDRPRALP